MMLITRPEHDATTKYLSIWSELVLKEAKSLHIDVIDLHRGKATKKDMDGLLA